MAKEMKRIDISDAPELLRVAKEVHDSREPRLLRRGNEDLAIVMPIKATLACRRGRVKTKADYEAFLSSAGSWKGIVDTDKLVADIYAGRRIGRRYKNSTEFLDMIY